MKPSARLSRFHSSFHRRAAAAFTLLEILVVLALIGLLVGLAVTNVGGIFGGKQEEITGLFVNTSMATPLQAYRMNMGSYPSTADGLQALIKPPEKNAGNWRGPYLKDETALPLDPWGEPYQYRCPGEHNKNSYDLWSKGPDKQSGTADDIGNWKTATQGQGQPGG